MKIFLLFLFLLEIAFSKSFKQVAFPQFDFQILSQKPQTAKTEKVQNSRFIKKSKEFSINQHTEGTQWQATPACLEKYNECIIVFEGWAEQTVQNGIFYRIISNNGTFLTGDHLLAEVKNYNFVTAAISVVLEEYYVVSWLRAYSYERIDVEVIILDRQGGITKSAFKVFDQVIDASG